MGPFDSSSSTQSPTRPVHEDQSTPFESVVAVQVNSPTVALPSVFNEQNNMGLGGLDSGYASQSSTPESAKPPAFGERVDVKGKNMFSNPIRKPRQLRAHNKPIPKLTW